VFDDGDLALVDRTRRTAAGVFDPAERIRWHRMLTFIAHQRGYKRGWVFHKFVEKFGVGPPLYSAEPIPPTPEVLSWVRTRVIAWAKAQQKTRAAS
jgi:DNA repair protein RadD